MMAIDAPVDSDTRMDMGALWAAIRHRLPRIVIVTAMLVGITYALLLFVPKSYESTASILVESRNSVYTQPATSTPGGQGPTESPDSMISSQIELVKSRDTLLPVVRSLGLDKIAEFNGGEGSGLLTKLFRRQAPVDPETMALTTLSQHLTVVRQRDSALISVTVRSEDPALAAKLANAIAEADVARRADFSLIDTADASQWLDQQITVLRKRVDEAATKVANFRVANGLYAPSSTSTSLLEQQATQVSAQITAAQERKDSAQSRAKLIRGLLAAGQPIDGVDDVRNSVTIQQLVQQKAQLTSQRAQLLATLLPSHPNVAAVAAQIGAIDRQISTEGRRVADALDAESQIEGTLLASLNDNLAAVTAKQAEATRQGVQLDALDRESKADQALLESYMSRYRDAVSRTNASAALPDLRVLTSAVPATTPAAPKTALILAAVGFVSLALQIGAILFGELLSGRALYEPGPRGAADRQAPEDLPLRGGFAPARDEEEPHADELVAVAEPDESDLPDADTATPVTAEAAPARRENGGLRRWFGKRARAVGGVLSAYEPPLVASTASAESAIDAAPAVVMPAADTISGVPQDEAGPDAAAAEPAEIVAGESDIANAQRVANLSADLILGRARVVILAGLDSPADADRLQGKLIRDSLHRGLSVARVDAGSSQPSAEPGITDLAAEAASFGDVVHRTAEEGLAQVPWGQYSTLLQQSSKPSTLIEALSDLYEVVLVNAGCVDADSSLPVFAGLDARLVLVAPPGADQRRIEVARAEAAGLGYRQVEVLMPPVARAEVA